MEDARAWHPSVQLYEILDRASGELLARFYTGPVGHLVAGIADWAELLARWNLQRLRDKVRRRAAGPR